MDLVFETQRLLLKPLLESDLNALHRIFINPYVRKYLCDDNFFSLQQVEEMLIESQKLFNEKKFGLWFIETKDEREVIGFVGLWYFFDEAQPQLVYALLPEATKKGYATEAATKILEYCFDLGYQYLLASCDKPNFESRKVAERIGMREVEEKIVNGKPLLFFKIEGCRNTVLSNKNQVWRRSKGRFILKIGRSEDVLQFWFPSASSGDLFGERFE